MCGCAIIDMVDEVALNSFGPHDWRDNFRVSKQTFDNLSHKLQPLIEKQNTNMRRSVPVERHEAITLWIIATLSEYRPVSHLFSLARCTECVIVHETWRAIVRSLQSEYISFPTGDSLKIVVEGFRIRWGIPQCAGSIDDTHIPITPPAMNHTDYYNRKGWYSTITQAIVDHNGPLFRDLRIGWPGSVHDARVFSNSTPHAKVNRGELLQGDELHVRRAAIPLYLIGDSAYPLLSWIIKPFPYCSPLSQQQKNYNYRITRGRIVVEMAFGKLKKKTTRRLRKKIDMFVGNVPYITLVCCILHNICEVHSDTFNDEWLEDLSA